MERRDSVRQRRVVAKGGACTDLLARAAFFAAIAAAALLSPMLLEHREPSWEQRVARGQELLTQTLVPELPTPTPTGAIANLPLPTEEVTAPTETPVVILTEVPTETPSDITPVAPSETTTVGTASPIFKTETPTPTVVITATPNTSVTAVPTPTLPPLSDVPDVAGTTTTVILQEDGGRAATNDGRVVIDIPAGALQEPMRITITRKSMDQEAPAHPDAILIARWQFDAESTASGTPIHQFAKPLNFNIRLTADEFPRNLDPSTLAFWSLDESTQRWLLIPSTSVPGDLRLSAQADHFSDDAISANSLVDVAPLLDGTNVGVQTSGAEINIPITVPPGRGGLAPQLTFSYSSNRVLEMRGYGDSASWAGLGWELDVPNVQVSWWGDSNDPPRAFLSMNGLGGEIMQEGTDGGQYIWRTRDEKYARIRSSCLDFNCEVNVWDQRGTKYVFGSDSTSAFERWYRDASNVRRIYRLDVRYIVDVLGNQIDFEYFQQVHDGPSGNSDVMAAYPKRIAYNGGNAEVLFNDGDPANHGWETSFTNPYDSIETIRQRDDTPRNKTNTSCSLNPMYTAPRIRETRKLTSVEVKVAGARVRRYVPNFRQSASFSTECWQNEAAAAEPGPSDGLRLDDIAVTDRNGASYSYTTTRFEYRAAGGSWDMHYRNSDDNIVFDYDRPILETVTNGLGGTVTFEYARLSVNNHGVYHWHRPAVISERHSYGVAQPEVVTTFEHPTIIYFFNYPNPYQPTTLDRFRTEFRGFGEVHELDSNGSRIIHKYHPSGSWSAEALSQREYSTETRDSQGVTWEKHETTYTARNVANNLPSVGYAVNFVAPTSVTRTMRDGTVKRINYIYDGDTPNCPTQCFGLVTKVDDFGEYLDVSPADGIEDTTTVGDRVTTRTAYHLNTTAWLFPPKYVEKIEAEPTTKLLGCSRSYYDGATSVATAPTRGLLTATSSAVDPATTVAQCEGTAAFTSSTNSYSVYETYASGTASYGNVAKQSVASWVPPETATTPSPPPSLEWGWIPVTTPAAAFTETTYDSTHHVFATQVTDPVGLVTTSTWDYVLGKPLTVAAPNGNATTNVYDGLGRLIRSYDNLDADARPTVRYQYDWDNVVPNRTIVERLANDGTPTGTYRRSISCVDGFSREYDAKSMYNGTSYASVRTDYDAVGRKAAVSNAFLPTDGDACASVPVAVRTLDRTMYSYDALGNAVATMSARANRPDSGPGQWTIVNGRTTTSLDGNLNATEQVQHPAARTVDTREPVQLPTVTTIRPTSDILTQWSRNTGTSWFWDYIDDDPTPDDETTFLSETATGEKSIHGFVAPTIPSGTVVSAVRFNVRWKHYNATYPAAAGDLWPIFRQNGVDTRGPTFRSPNGDNWVDDSWTMPVNPRTGQPWTVTELSNVTLAFGFEMYSATGASPSVTHATVQIITRPTTASPTVQSFNGNGNLVSVTDPMSNVTSLSHDLLGHKTAMTDPDMGTWSYAYNPDGTLSTQTDARILTTGTPNTMITTTLSYDAAGRLLSKSFNNGDPTVSFSYDSYLGGDCAEPAQTAVGHMTKMTDGYGATWSCFDVRGRETKTRRSVDGVNYDLVRHYDPLNAVDQLTYPDGEVVAYNENGVGQTTSMTSNTYAQTLLSSVNYEPSGALSWYRLGNDLLSSFSYDFRQRLDSAQTQGAQNLLLTYDDASNIVGYGDDIVADSASFGYDHLNRLTSASYTPGTDTAAYSYNPIGNLLSKQEGASNNTLNYPSSGLPRPHAVTSSSGSLARTYRYDANGNMYASVLGTNQPAAAAYGFDAENRLTDIVLAPPYSGAGPGFQCIDQDGNGTINVIDLSQVAQGNGHKPGRPNFALRDVTADGNVNVMDLQREQLMYNQSCPTTAYRYAYDGNGTQIKRTVRQNSTTSSTVYIGGVYEKTNTGAVKKYYTAFGRTVAIRDVPTGSGAGTLYYPLSDHLGSTSTVLDANGSLVSSQRYWPYGATRSGSVPQTDRLYTGQRQEPGDAAMGLYNYKARFYSTTLGRFVSADPVDALNRYAYVANNPLRFVDPSGNTMNIACGTTNQCENGSDIGGYREAIIAEWVREGRYPDASQEFLSQMFDFWFTGALKAGWNGQRTADIFGIVFQDVGGWVEAGKDYLAGWGDVSSFLDHNALFGPQGADIWLGFSQGGGVVFEALQRAYNDSSAPLPIGAILIEPALRERRDLNTDILQLVRVITWADEDWTPVPGGVHGWLYGALRFRSDDCGGWKQHCSHQPWQGVMVQVASLPPGSATVDEARGMARGAKVDCALMGDRQRYLGC